MKALYTSLLVLLCWTSVQAQEPQEHEYVPMLREDLVWVGNPGLQKYYIVVEGDTVVDGTAFKKVFRRLSKDASLAIGELPEGLYHSGFVFDDIHPVGLLREEMGRVYRYISYDKKDRSWVMANFDYATDDNTYTYIDTSEHYEQLMYDFNDPNMYKDITFVRGKDVQIEGTPRRVYYRSERYMDDNDPIQVLNQWLMVEGLGMVMGWPRGNDLLSPRRRPVGLQIPLGAYYVRNNKGVVLAYNDLYGYYEDNQNWIWTYTGDPYDFSGDGKFDIEDLNAVINIMIGKQDDNMDKSADLTFEGTVDIEDLNLVINRMVSGVQPVKYSDLLKPKSEY